MYYEDGKKLIEKKYFNQALKYFQTCLKNKPNDLRANFQMGKIYYELNNLKQSIIFFQRCNEIQPNNLNILFNLALTLQAMGKVEEAKNKYLEVIYINSNHVKSYYGLNFLNNKNITHEFYKNLKKINEENKASIFEKSLINFIFSKIEKKKKNFKKEINFLNLSHKLCYESNLLINKQSNFYYEKIISKHYDNIKFVKSFESIENFNNSQHIFIIGLPRSGSTLVETIISHNENNIVSLGEFHGINTSILSQIGNKIYSKNFDTKNYQLELNKKIFQDSLLEKYNNFDKKIFLDKSLENFFNIEIILEFFPNSKFIHTYRDFNDAIIAIYQTMLPELSWCHKIDDIINYYNLYKNTIEYFKKKYPNKIIDVELNKLTNQKETETKKILNFCEIKYNENYLEYNKNFNLFNKTNSFLQVREKIKPYEDKKYQEYYYLLNK